MDVFKFRQHTNSIIMFLLQLRKTQKQNSHQALFTKHLCAHYASKIRNLHADNDYVNALF